VAQSVEALQHVIPVSIPSGVLTDIQFSFFSVHPGAQSSNKNEYEGISLRVKWDRRLELKTLPSFFC
jgi:hypothetical protein